MEDRLQEGSAFSWGHLQSSTPRAANFRQRIFLGGSEGDLLPAENPIRRFIAIADDFVRAARSLTSARACGP